LRPLDSAAVIDLSSLCLLIVRRAYNLYYAFGFALRIFFLSLSFFLLAPCLRCTVAISALQTVIWLDTMEFPFGIERFWAAAGSVDTSLS
jgi:hypothetical protein